ncbi:helical backbone metal receptor [Mucilaginibacter sp.]|uniref:helical backbone metal receptor n=1 Tax=Mucilaginibacter sp. TaxID=1882438 RepID=UPI00261806D5|nr:helical backbone metal receptor [Mucilaginibacter sp.]MDB4923777.1 cobalamin-binding protein [Mucilaginibacter sp.]
MPIYSDQFNREINLPSVPKRIISVVPSQTELLFYLGLNEEVIGITKFCIHPADKFKSATKIGGTKQLDIAKIKSLNPDLIIANKEENERSQLEELMEHFPVWISDIYNLEGALEMIERVGELVDRKKETAALNNSINQNFTKLNLAISGMRAAYFIWRKPYMVAGKNTFIDSMLQKCGLINAFEMERYPEVDALLLSDANPDVILLSSEPYPFKEKHIAELKAIVPTAIIKLVDGEMFSWYGNRLLGAPEYFDDLVKNLIRLQ